MSHHWLLISFWFCPVSLQYINSGGDFRGEPVLENPQSSSYFSLPYVNYLNSPTQNNDIDIKSEPLNDAFNQFYSRIGEIRKKRTVTNVNDGLKQSHWYPNLVEADPNYSNSEENVIGPILAAFRSNFEDNSTNFISSMEPVYKKNFSPWGGKRDNLKPNLESMWTWKRTGNLREPTMPKRVRFSPWGGKRSGQMIFKPGSKGSMIIYSTSIPELTQMLTRLSPSGRTLNWDGVQFIQKRFMEKRHPFKLLSMTASLDNKVLRNALPFKTFLDQLPKVYKPGHPYLDMNLKKDGKRKVKFSAWGGKRSPPIIGPIWSPTPQEVKDLTLNSILLIRNSQDPSESTKAL